MKKIIKRLLLGIVPFLPMEKINADTDTQNTPEEVLSNSSNIEKKEFQDLEKILNGDLEKPKHLAGTEQIEELLALLEEEETKNSSTNATAQVSSDNQTISEQSQQTNITNNASVEAQTSAPTISNVSEIVSSPITNTATKVVEQVQPLNNENPVTTNISETTSSTTNTEVVLPPALTPQATTQLVSKTEIDFPSNKQEQTKIQSPQTTQEDLKELLTLIEKEGTAKDQHDKTTPIQDREWFPWLLALIVSGALTGSVWLSNKFEKIVRKRKQEKVERKKQEKIVPLSLSTNQTSAKPAAQINKLDSQEATTNQGNSDVFFANDAEDDECDPDEPKTTFIDPQKMQDFLSEIQDEKAKTPKATKIQPTSKKKKEKTPTLVIEDEEKAQQMGIRMMSNIKIRRMAINRKMKALRAEIGKYHQSESEWLNIASEMNALQEERNQLTKENRYARTLVKGKQGELIQEERRLYAKEMRLAKKTNDEKRMIQIIQKRAIIKGREKELIEAAQKQVKERIETATWWHGKRLYSQALQKEEAINQKIKQLKKETGLKKKEILEADSELSESLKKVQHEKRLACQQMKGRKFTQQRRLLSKQIIEAHNLGDIETENQLKEELSALKTKEKEHMERSKNFDYSEGKRSVVPYSVAQHAERRDRANRWKGYRMLRDLKAKMVPSVNTNEITAQEYETKAHSLIGKTFDNSFNYEKSRAKALKPSTLAHIYLSKKERGLI